MIIYQAEEDFGFPEYAFFFTHPPTDEDVIAKIKNLDIGPVGEAMIEHLKYRVNEITVTENPKDVHKTTV